MQKSLWCYNEPAMSVCALLGGAGAFVVSTYIIIFPMLYRGACKERDVFYLVLLHSLVLEIHC